MTKKYIAPMVRIGFEIGTGKPVDIQLGHIGAFGQTQKSGKTTALEAIVSRANVRALAFITKRSESGFSTAHPIAPYFNDRADWMFVESILQTLLNQRMRYERAWIMTACEGQSTLAGVQRNARTLELKARQGTATRNAYMMLGKYFEIVVPAIARLPKLDELQLQPGLNVMDLRAYPPELHMLIIASSLRWIHQHEEQTVTIIPEAWKMVPQGKNTPVKVEAENLVREGAAIGNFVCFDSQDMAGIDNLMLRAASVWIIGKQREHNEVERALKNMDIGVKLPKASEMRRLTLGQFFVADDESLTKTYVWPAWMDEKSAQAIARGELDIANAPVIETHIDRPAPEPEPINTPDESETDEMANSDDILAAVNKTNEGIEQTNKDIRALAAAINKQRTTGPATTDTAAPSGSAPSKPARVATDESPTDDDALYQRFRDRFIAEFPAVLEVIQEQPEIHITVHRPVIEMDNKSLTGKIAVMLHDGFFDSGATASAVQKLLEKQGMEFPTSNPVYASLNELKALGAFTIEDPGGKKGKIYIRAEGLKFTKKVA